MIAMRKIPIKLDEIQPQEVAVYVESTDHAHEVLPVTVTVEGKTLPAARYTNEHGRTAIYVAGKLPPCKLRKGSTLTCFLVEGDPRDWYVACYYPQVKARRQVAPNPEFSARQPFGYSFILMPWDIEGESIDHYAPRTYKRVPVTVNLL